MIFNIGTEKLLYVMSRIGQVVDKKHSSPILANTLVIAKENSVSFRATDLNSAVEVSVDGDVETEGATTVPVETISKIARVLPRDSLVHVDFDPATQKAKISSGMTSYVIATLPTTDFPKVDDDEFNVSFEIESSLLNRIFDKTKFAISTDESRMHLNGVYLHNHGEGEARKFTGVAIDGIQMAVVKDTVPEGAEELNGIIIPEKTVNEFSRMFADQSMIRVSTSASRLKIRAPGIVYISRLIESDYPQYDRLIPNNTDIRLVVNANILLSAINRVSSIVSETECRISFDMSDGNLSLSASAFGRGQATDTVPVECNIDDLKIRFKNRSLSSVLTHIGEGQATFLFNEDSRAVMVLDSEDENSIFMLMPSR